VPEISTPNLTGARSAIASWLLCSPFARPN
jgi:hypothetical protein